MTALDLCNPSTDSLDLSMDRCSRLFPCLSDPARRSALVLKASLVIIHVIYVGVLFLFDGELMEKTRREPWFTSLYLLLFLVTLVQYFITSSSSPGYVLDAVRAINESNAVYKRPASVNSKQPASSKYGTMVGAVDSCRSALLEENSTSWPKILSDLYPPGFSIRSMLCTSCNIEQPPRAKHCHDCERCVLQFDHHCVWLGTCIGQGNHCKFWWYIFEETALCLWTGFLYITYLKTNMAKAWWKAAVMIMLLIILSISLIFLLLLLGFHSYLALTNQTTFEIIRRRRILYLRGIPIRVNPFSQGICRNIFNFCCADSGVCKLEALPSSSELEESSRPYTCLDCVTCRCC